MLLEQLSRTVLANLAHIMVDRRVASGAAFNVRWLKDGSEGARQTLHVDRYGVVSLR